MLDWLVGNIGILDTSTLYWLVVIVVGTAVFLVSAVVFRPDRNIF
jgi:hypothetical protein